ncbi:restriction endonuclease [Dactylosporangium aurantiacum]|uniref:Restriction endonuclease n=1 Tax=Dactylosporangium aurantiacum TaxID=35754 RepID=A0A9Q9ML22_9ACTN|nr:restriction endonuclease [Dactylosporangium aurantiacum]MDG6108285.1 restriction endonuclease [Dactylosporangium aurantiacum]UWZ58525.1 restriction endonuclease [Dactylosporangium aurantiacum]
MSDNSPATTAAAGEEDHWPSFDITPKGYEEAVAAIAGSMDLELVGWEVKHLDPLEGLDGTYVMDVTARFQLAGMDFLILFECKRHKDPVKRSDVQVLLTKLQSTGAQKGVVVAATGFQSGAIEFAKAHGIACVRLVDDAWAYLTRHTTATTPPVLTGRYCGYALTPDGDGDYDFALLNGSPDNARSTLITRR